MKLWSLVGFLVICIMGCQADMVVDGTRPSMNNPATTSAVGTMPLPTSFPPTIPALPTATLTATLFPTPTPLPSPTATATHTLTPTTTATPIDGGPIYEDTALAFAMQLPEGWTGSHTHGTTTIVNEAGESQLYVRSYLTRSGFYSAQAIAERTMPPQQRADLVLTEVTIGRYRGAVSNTAVTFLNVGGRFLAFTPLSSDPLLPTLLHTVRGKPTDFNDNYMVVSSENWLAEVVGGANITETLTVQRRDGQVGYTLFTEPATSGLGYDLTWPLFFSSDERYFYYNVHGVADGCGLYGGGDLIRVDLDNGSQMTLTETGGVGHVLAADGASMVFVNGRSVNEFTLTHYYFENGSRETIDFSLPGSAPAVADGLVFSPNEQRVAFAAEQAACAEGWMIGTVDLTTADLSLYPAEGIPWFRPVAWEEDVLTLRPYISDETKHLDLRTNEIGGERP